MKNKIGIFLNNMLHNIIVMAVYSSFGCIMLYLITAGYYFYFFMTGKATYSLVKQMEVLFGSH